MNPLADFVNRLISLLLFYFPVAMFKLLIILQAHLIKR